MNTMTAKWADTLGFDHPFFQSMCMFVGMLSCLPFYVAMHYLRQRSQISHFDGITAPSFRASLTPQFNPLIFFPPTCCDVLSTSMMFVGLNMTTASSFQMLRGSVIIFTALLSIFFLRDRLPAHKWVGVGAVFAGLFIVGASDYGEADTDPRDMHVVIVGDLFIVLAQIVVATQMVLEQKYLRLYDVPPLVTVGLEGLYGLAILSVLCVPMYFIHVPATFSKNPDGRLEDIFYAFHQMGQKPMIMVALLLQIISVAFFNFSSISITKQLSATTRTMLDNVRTLIVWALSIPLFHEKFIPIQLLGFGLLILGVFIYNGLLPGFRGPPPPAAATAILIGDGDEEEAGGGGGGATDRQPLLITTNHQQEPNAAATGEDRGEGR